MPSFEIHLVLLQIVGGALNEDLINLFTAAVLTGGLMLVTRCLNVNQVILSFANHNLHGCTVIHRTNCKFRFTLRVITLSLIHLWVKLLPV